MPSMAARREWSLWPDHAIELGVPDVIILHKDVADPDDYNRYV